MDRHKDLLKMYELLNEHFGDLHWWPADTSLEVIVGAILTQNTSWTNVEKAIGRMRERDLLNAHAIDEISQETLADIIRSSGYYRLKAGRLKSFIRFFCDEYGGDMDRMSREPLESLRKKLLDVKGIGPETADSILLYGCGMASFVNDAYTERILRRHSIIVHKRADYDEIRELFMKSLPNETPLFKQYHALMVNAGKIYCRKTAQCTGCPLERFEAGAE